VRGAVRVSVGDYEVVRGFAQQHFVVAGHEVLDSERIVSEREGFFVVESRAARTALHSVRVEALEHRLRA